MFLASRSSTSSKAYWSPIDKEQTNPLRVLSWLFQSTFVPLSDVKILATLAKLAFDLGYMVLALGLGFCAAIFLTSSAIRAYHAYTTIIPNDLRGLLIAAVGAYLAAQALASIWAVVTRRARVSLWGVLIIVLLALGGLAYWPGPHAAPNLHRGLPA